MNVDKTLEKKRLEQKIKEFQEHLQQKVDEQTGEIRTLFLGSIEALVFALSKDKRLDRPEKKSSYFSGLFHLPLL